MKGVDAAKQASFYAGTVDRYLSKGQVSNAVVLQDRKKSVAARPADSALTFEDVAVRLTSPTTATVSGVRHFSVRNSPTKTTDSYVPEQLTLTQIDGQWKITSENENKAAAYELVNN
jgi:hypothetical protein